MVKSCFVDPTPTDGATLQPMYSDLQGGQFSADFQIKAHIYDPKVRYRQYVKGTYKYNKLAQSHHLDGGNISATQFLEDANEQGTYGDRKINKRGLSWYKRSEDDSFDIFTANDTPGDLLQCAPGTLVEIHLTFRGVLVDVDNDKNVHDERKWKVVGHYQMPGGQPSTRSGACPCTIL
jgi:hypothetical protein